MIKQTLYFSSPAYLSLKNSQLFYRSIDGLIEKEVTRAVEDIGIVVLDNNRITITHNLIKALQENKTAILSCDDSHMPHSLMLPLEGHSEQSERYRHQIEATVPLKKNLWQQTIVAKINNQRRVLQLLDRPYKRLEVLAKRIQSGDPDNIEGQAAAYYWSKYIEGFKRDRMGDPPNNLLNYGYAVLRAMIARSLVSSGLLTTLGIHHKNKYNAYCLADDIMEPYRPFVDLIVHEIHSEYDVGTFLSKSARMTLLGVAEIDAQFGKRTSPLMVGMSQTSASLAMCYMQEKRKIKYPSIIMS